MNKKQLKEYLLKIAKEGYANAEKENSWVKEENGSTTITHEDGDFSMHDNFFGGEPYGGRQVIFYKEKPVWIMVYYGKVDKSVPDVKNVYTTLQKALAISDPDMPLRGPKMFLSGGMQYVNHCHGDIEEYEGKESIVKDGKEVYSASYMGGYVDQRAE